jgi:hypothetical protein
VRAMDNDWNSYTRKAGDLLKLWRARLGIYEDGVATLSSSTMDAVRRLVHRLDELDQSEDVHITVTEQRPRTYVVRRIETGEVIAKIGLPVSQAESTT